MITQSGSEGISLKNVRQVHILESYWNDVRIKQVVGRAVRANSHIALPAKERHVDIYMYQTTFTENQKRNSTVISRENGVTSDEYIYGISMKKERLTNTMLDIVKSAAVDCLVHRKIHKGVKCSVIPANYGQPIKGVLYSYKSVHDDPTDEVLAKQKKTVKRERIIGFVKCAGKGVSVRVPYFKDTLEVLDKKKYENGEHVVIGRVVRLEDNRAKVVIYEEDEA